MLPGGKALQQPALGFYDEGKLFKGYAIGDLIKEPASLPRSVSHFQWKKDQIVDDERGQFVVTTNDGQRLIFDVHTGEVIGPSLKVAKPSNTHLTKETETTKKSVITRNENRLFAIKIEELKITKSTGSDS